MRTNLAPKGVSLTLAAALGLGLLTPLALTQISCSSPAKDKADSQNPYISNLEFSDLASATTTWPTDSFKRGNNWTITAGTSTYILGNFAQVGGTAVLMPGGIAMTSNTPIKITPAATQQYTLTVTDAKGRVTTKTATVTVVPMPDTTITAVDNVIAATAGYTASVHGAPTNPAGTTYKWTVVNGTITSDITQPSITFTAGGTNPDNSPQVMTLKCQVTNPAKTPVSNPGTKDIMVNTPVPASLSYSNANATFYVAVPVQANVPTTAGYVQSFAVTPALPDGLVLDTVTGVITGTPTTLSPKATYTMSAINYSGSVNTQVQIEVLATPSLVFNPPTPAKIGPGGSAMLSWNAGSDVDTLTITSQPVDSSLPATFANTGTANVTPALTTTYTLTGTAVGGGTIPVLTQTVTVDTVALAVSTLTAAPMVAPFGGSTTLHWTTAGTANSFSLASNFSATPIAASIAGTATQYPVNNLVRRQTMTLTATNGAGSAQGSVIVAAAGLDTLAGNVVRGGGNHDGKGTAAQFNQPENMATDPQGNIYVADTVNQTVRMIQPDGTVTTLAGMAGVAGTLDNDSGLKVQFNNPRGVAYWRDPNNSNAPYLFVADATNNVIRKITLSGTTQPITATNVKIFAGTMGSYGNSTALLDSPEAIVIDSNNKMYVAEFYNDVALITGLGNAVSDPIATYAGTRGASNGYLDGLNTSAKFYQLNSIAIDNAGNLYVTEAGGNRVRKITPTNTTTVAGDTAGTGAGGAGLIDGAPGTSRLFSPSAVTVNATGTFAWIADAKNNAVRKLDLSNNTLTTMLGATTAGNTDAQGLSARFAGPQGIVFDGAGNLIVAELGNNDLRMIDPALNVTTFAGSSPVVGYADSTVGSPAGALAISPALSTNGTMAGLTMDANGNTYVADVYNNAIRKITPAGVMTTISGTPGLAIDASHVDGGPATATFWNPAGLAMDPSGNIYVADQGNNTIRQMTWDAVNQVWNTVTIAGTAGTTGATDGTGPAALFKFPYGVAFNTKDNALYVSEYGNAKLRKLTYDAVAKTWTSTTLTLSGYTLKGPMGIAFDANGNMVVAEKYNYCVLLLTAPVSPATAWAAKVIGGISGAKGFQDGPVAAAKPNSSMFNQPEGVSVDAAGNIYVADFSNQLVRKIAYDTVNSVWVSSTVLGSAANTNTPPTSSVPLGTALGSLGTASVFAPQSVLVTPNGHDLIITSNGGVAQATSIDNQ